MPPSQQNPATVTGNMQTIFGKVKTYGSWDTDKQTQWSSQYSAPLPGMEALEGIERWPINGSTKSMINCTKVHTEWIYKNTTYEIIASRLFICHVRNFAGNLVASTNIHLIQYNQISYEYRFLLFQCTKKKQKKEETSWITTDNKMAEIKHVVWLSRTH